MSMSRGILLFLLTLATVGLIARLRFRPAPHERERGATMKVLVFAAMNLALSTPRVAQSADSKSQARPAAPVSAPVPGGCNTPVGEPNSDVGCYLDATEMPCPPGCPKRCQAPIAFAIGSWKGNPT